LIVYNLLSIDRILNEELEYKDYDEKVKSVRIKDIISYFENHDYHSDRHDPDHIAWNIKVRDFDIKENHYEEFGLDHKWDEKWEEYVNQNYELFGQMCELGLDFAGSNNMRSCDFMGESNYKLYCEGRSGGWLALHEFDGYDTNKIVDSILEIIDETIEEMIDDIRECRLGEKDHIQHDLFIGYKEKAIDGIDYYTPIYKFCKALDNFDATKEFLNQLAFHRCTKEEEWGLEEKAENGLLDLPGQMFLSKELEALC